MTNGDPSTSDIRAPSYGVLGCVCFGYLGGLQGTGHQCGHTANVSEHSLAADVSSPGEVPQDAGDHLMKLLAVRGQLGHQSLEGALL